MSEPHGTVQLREEIKLAIAGALEAAGGQEHVEELQCVICLRPALRPTKTPCGHLFHQHCLEDALRARRRCPTCREEFPADNAKVFLSCRTLNSIGGRVRVRCPQGCGAEEMRFDALAAHVGAGGDCPRTPVRCENEECGQVSERRDAQRHLADCPHRLEPCPNCDKSFKPADMRLHVEGECANRPTECAHCRQVVAFSKMQQHLRDQCTAPVPMRDYVQLQESTAAALRGQEQRIAQQDERNAEQQQRIAALEQRAAELLNAQQQQEQRTAELRNELMRHCAQLLAAQQAEHSAKLAAVERRLVQTGTRVLETLARPEKASSHRGLMFDLESKGQPVAVTALWIAHQTQQCDWEIWGRAAEGSYMDQQGPEGWAKLSSGNYDGAKHELHRCPLSRPVPVPPDGRRAFYIYSSSGWGVVYKHTSDADYAPAADGAVAVRPGTYGLSKTRFEMMECFHGKCDFVGRIEYAFLPQ